MSDNGHWYTLESDPGLFTLLVREFQVEGAQFEELYSLDKEAFIYFPAVHALIFLFKYDPKKRYTYEGKMITNEEDLKESGVYFMNQTITNACGTQAILSALLNIDHDDIDNGTILRAFKEFTIDMDSHTRGLSLSNADHIRQAHNSFARYQLFEDDQSLNKYQPKEDVFHFTAFVPVKGKLYELDGLKNGPICYGEVENGDWMKRATEILQTRMDEYHNEEIRFNCLALISNKLTAYERQLAAIQEHEGRRMDVEESDDSSIEAQVAELTLQISDEYEKERRWKRDHALRRMNFLPFIAEILKITASKNELSPLIEDAKKKRKKL